MKFIFFVFIMGAMLQGCATYALLSAKASTSYCESIQCHEVPEGESCEEFVCFRRYCSGVENPSDCEHINDLVVICKEDESMRMKECIEEETKRKSDVLGWFAGFFQGLLQLGLKLL